MVQQVKINDGTNTILQFPDGMSKQDMQDAIEKYYLPKNSTQPSKSIINDSHKSTLYQKYLEPTVDATKEGLERSAAGVNQLIYPVIDKALGTSLNSNMEKSRNANAQQFNQKYANNPYAKGMAKIVELIPYFAGGTVTDAAVAPKLVTSAIKDLPKAAQYIGNALGIAGKNAALGGIAGSTDYDPTGKNYGPLGGIKKGLNNALPSAALGTAAAGIVRTPQSIPKIMTKLFGDTNIDELSKINKSLGNYKTSIGDVIKSPTIKKFQETALSSIPFSGVEKTQLQTGKRLQDEGKKLVNSLKNSNNNGNVGNIIQNALIKNHDLVQKQKNNLYEKVDDLAIKNKINIKGNNYIKKAKSILSDLNGGIFTNDIQDKDINTLKSELLNITQSDKSGNLKNANITHGLLNDKAKQAFSFQKDYVGTAYSQLAKSLKSDIDNAINKSSSQDLKNAYLHAQEHYRNKVAPFQDRDIAKFIRQGADPDTIVNYFIRSGKNDRSNLLSKLTNKINPDEKNAIAHEYLKQAYSMKKNDSMPTLSPTKLVSFYNKLGKNTRKTLFPKNFRDQMENYITKVDTNEAALSAMANPKTGVRNADIIKSTIGAMMGMSGLHGNILPSLALGAGANLTKRALNSKTLRDLYLKGLMPLKKPSKLSGGLVGLASYNQ